MRITQFIGKAGLLLGLLALVVLSGCSDDRRETGTQVPILEQDVEGLEYSADYYKANPGAFPK